MQRYVCIHSIYSQVQGYVVAIIVLACNDIQHRMYTRTLFFSFLFLFFVFFFVFSSVSNKTKKKSLENARRRVIQRETLRAAAFGDRRD